MFRPKTSKIGRAMRIVVVNVAKSDKYVCRDIARFDERLTSHCDRGEGRHFTLVPADLKAVRFELYALALANGCDPSRNSFIVDAKFVSAFQQACWTRDRGLKARCYKI